MNKKTKVLMSLLVLGLLAALIGGATMAWFTDDAVIAGAEFKAGTVIVNADGPNITPMDDRSIDNVNPGDCATIEWNIVNEGTKRAQFKVKLNKAWLNGLSTGNVFVAPVPNSGWVMDEDGDDLWFYYTGAGDGVPGTFNGATLEDRTVPLKLVVGFDGELTHNDYQGQKFVIGGDAWAVQATNGAPAAVWGEIWNTVSAPGYVGTGANYNYFLTGPGKDMPCWDYHNGGGEPVVEVFNLTTGVGKYVCDGWVVKNSLGLITLDPPGGSYAAGDVVKLSVSNTAWDGYKFSRWEVKVGSGGSWNNLSSANPYNYTMPAGDVALQAVFVLGAFWQ